MTIEDLAGNVNNLGKKVEDLADLMEKGFVHVEERFVRADERFNSIDSELSHIKTKLQEHDHRFDTIDEWRGISDKVIDKTYQKIDDFSRRITKLEKRTV